MMGQAPGRPYPGSVNKRKTGFIPRLAAGTLLATTCLRVDTL